jgi:cytochrome P450
MIIAGNETTTKLLANAVYWLQQHPAARKEVCESPALIPQWVEETLRYDNSTQLMARTVTEDFSYQGRAMERGQKVLLLIGSANRDERVFPSPDLFDIHRDTSQHLSFGRGTHFCLGAALAQLGPRRARRCCAGSGLRDRRGRAQCACTRPACAASPPADGFSAR